MTTWQRKISEYEADLYTIQTSWWSRLFQRSKGGEVEVKHYDNGEKRMEIDLHGMKCPDGTLVQVVIDGKLAREVEIRRRFARLRLNSADGEVIPDVHGGSTVEVHCMGKVLLEGRFMHD